MVYRPKQISQVLNHNTFYPCESAVLYTTVHWNKSWVILIWIIYVTILILNCIEKLCVCTVYFCRTWFQCRFVLYYKIHDIWNKSLISEHPKNQIYIIIYKYISEKSLLPQPNPLFKNKIKKTTTITQTWVVQQQSITHSLNKCFH